MTGVKFLVLMYQWNEGLRNFFQHICGSRFTLPLLSRANFFLKMSDVFGVIFFVNQSSVVLWTSLDITGPLRDIPKIGIPNNG